MHFFSRPSATGWQDIVRMGVFVFLATGAAAVLTAVAAERTPVKAPPNTKEAAAAKNPAGTSASPKEARELFQHHVRPLLQSRCWQCHGPEQQKGGLRLDQQKLALQGGDTGPAIVPHRSAESELLSRVSSTDAALRMPPPASKLAPLKPAETALLRQWIDNGAVWTAEVPATSSPASQHWAFQPIRRPVPPVTAHPEFVKNPIDAFVQAKLQGRHWLPAPPADRTTLIKRVYYDLLGLPPQPAQVAAFLADLAPDAYERLIDSVLASPHFGERWGRHWLDMARYADSDGYEKDNPRPHAWRYRDWVIDAVNRDLPFDQFTVEQLAGDLLPNATLDQKLATAFHRQTLTNTEGGTDKEQFRVEACIDRVNTTSTVWLGLTAGCAQCHSHKYDPLTQTEYYQLFAFFNNGDEQEIEMPISAAAVADYKTKLAAVESSLTQQERRIAARKSEISANLPGYEAQWRAKLTAAESDLAQTPQFVPFEITNISSVANARFTKLADGSYRADDSTAPADLYPVSGKSAIKEITGLRLELLPDAALPQHGPGWGKDGRAVLSEVRVYANSREEFEDPALRIETSGAESDVNEPQFPPSAAIDGKETTGWKSKAKPGQPSSLTIFFKQALKFPADAWIKVVLSQQHGDRATLGRFRLSVRTGRSIDERFPRKTREILQIPTERRTAEQRREFIEFLLQQDETGTRLLHELAELKKKIPARPFLPAAVILQRQKAARETHVLRRGDFLQPGPAVKPGTLAILPVLQSRNSGSIPDRLDLARWLVREDNPLPRRVLVNQVWAKLFGRGIVPTVTDFGTRGELPSHPDLLDWLATEFSRLKWSRKALIKTILTSHTYQQSSALRPELLETDPQNSLLARQNRFRVEAEIIRDLSLAVSGLLSSRVGGPSVYPPMPADVAAISYSNNFRWYNSTGEDRYRRGMYTFFKRTAPYPSLTTFDCPDFNVACVERGRSNTPLQALTTLNNETFAEAAQGFARRILTSHQGTDAVRIDFAFRCCAARPPRAAEFAELQKLLTAAREFYRQHPREGEQLVSLHKPAKIAPAEAAAWSAVARVLLNLDEFLTRE